MMDNSTISDAQFNEAWLRNASLREARLADAEFRSTDLKGADFSDVVDMSRVKFVQSSLSGARFDKAYGQDVVFYGSTGRATSFMSVEMQRVRFDGGEMVQPYFADAKLQQSRFVNIQIAGGDFTRANLNEARFSATRGGVAISSTTFANAQLRGAVFEGRRSRTRMWRLRMRDVEFSEANLDNAKFSLVALDQATFSGATAPGAEFRRLALSGNSTFERTNLQGALFHEVRWNGANLCHADLRGIRGKEVESSKNCEWLQEALHWDKTCRDEHLRCGVVGELDACTPPEWYDNDFFTFDEVFEQNASWGAECKR